MRSASIALVLALAAPAASAASAPPMVRKMPDLAKDVGAFPRLVGTTPAIAKINRALQAADARTLKEVRDCLRQSPKEGYWERAADMALRAEHFVSFTSQGDASCGGAHPDFFGVALTFDLRTGEPADWTKLLPPDLRGEPRPDGAFASPRLSALFVAQAEKDDPNPDCTEAFAEQAMHFELWPDAKEKGLAMRTTLRHGVQGVCGGPVVIPVETLKRLGVDAALIQDIETGDAVDGR